MSTGFNVPSTNGNNGPTSPQAIVSYPMLRYYKIEDSGNNLIYHCYAQPGSQLEGKNWFIALEDSDTTDITSVKFPQIDGVETAGFVHQLSSDNTEGNILTTIEAYNYGA